MVLYHGTIKCCVRGILKDGCLKARESHLSFATMEINKLLDKYIGRNIRDGAVYFWDDLSNCESQHTVNDSTYILNVDFNKLDPKKVFVANHNFSTLLFCTWYDYFFGDFKSYDEEGFEEKCREYAINYANSFLSYEEYVKNKDLQDEEFVPEILYFDSIGVEAIINEDLEQFID